MFPYLDNLFDKWLIHSENSSINVNKGGGENST